MASNDNYEFDSDNVGANLNKLDHLRDLLVIAIPKQVQAGKYDEDAVSYIYVSVWTESEVKIIKSKILDIVNLI